MALKDPTAWKDDLSFYKTERAVAGDAAALEPLLLHGGSKYAAATYVAMVGTLGALFGTVTLSPAIRQPLTFTAYVIVAALLLRGLYPLIVRQQSRAVAWLAMFAFFWTTVLGMFVLWAADRESTWAAYGISVGGGFFVGMMYGAFPPGVTRNEEAWGLAFLAAPAAASVATFVLRRVAAVDSLEGAIMAGAIAGVLFMGVMGSLLVHLWDESEGLAELGQIYLHNDNFAPQALAYLDRAIAMRPAHAPYYALRGVAYSRLGDVERASADWEQAIALAPRDPEPHVNRAIHCLRRGADREAIHALQTALEKDEGHGRAHAYLGVAWERLGDSARAFEHYDRAIALARDDAKVYCDRSFAHLRAGNHARALRDADRAVRLESHRGLGYAARGQALAKLGRDEEALESLEEAIELGIEPSVHEDALRTIEVLSGSDVEFEERG